MLKVTSTLGNTTASRKITRTENRDRLGYIRQTPGFFLKQPVHLSEEPHRRPMDLECHHYENTVYDTKMRPERPATRDDTTWTNIGATRSDRGQHNTG